MASRAKIVFYPSIGEEKCALDYITISDKYSGWTYNTSDFQTDGYVYTDSESSISTINSNYWIKFKPIAGYKFSDVHKTNSGDTSNNGDFTIETDGSVIVYPWNSGTSSIISNYLHIEVIEDTETKYTVDETLTNCTSDNAGSYTADSEVTITITAIDNYIFNHAPVATMGDTTLEFTVSDDYMSAYLTFTITDNVTISATAEQAYHALDLTLENCTCNYDGSVPHGTSTIIITANDGYVLNGVVEVTFNYVTYDHNNFTDGNTVCTFDIDVKYGNVSITAQAIEKTSQLSTFTNLYKVDNDTLSALAKVRFYYVDSETSEIVDYGQFITNLIKIPFDLPSSMIAGTGDIQLGNYDTNVNTDIIQTYIFNVDIGKIVIPEKYNNIYDYKETNCILHLPYSENMVIPVEYCINHTLNIEYKIDLYSGNCTVNIYSDFTNEIVDSKTFNIGVQIPFMQEQNNTVVSSLKNVLTNDLKTAFIEIVRNIPYNCDSIFGNETVDYGTLENYAGFVKVSDILLNISATNEEKDEIENLLKNGVYINDISLTELE